MWSPSIKKAPKKAKIPIGKPNRYEEAANTMKAVEKWIISVMARYDMAITSL